ncbi:MAG: NAD(P)-dependent alcohol dehydrogenase [Acidobacteriota bacterium]
MRAAQITGAFGLDEVRIQEATEKSLGPGEVRIRVEAVSLNFRDLLVAKGLYTKKLPFPLTLCSDCAGVVTETGAGVTRVKVGDRVSPCFMPDWIAGDITDAGSRSALGAFADGVLAETIVMKETALVHVPAHLSAEEAAALPCAAVTAWHALVVRCRIKAGDTVLAIGTGGVSLFALQIAKMHGARVVILSSSDEKLERARALGADDGINYAATPEWDGELKKRGLVPDHVVEVGGTATLAKSIKCVRAGGNLALIGNVSGGGEANIIPAFMKNLTLHGIFVGSREMFEALNRAVAVQQMKPAIGQVFAFDDTAAAMRHMESGAHFGKVVIRVS